MKLFNLVRPLRAGLLVASLGLSTDVWGADGEPQVAEAEKYAIQEDWNATTLTGDWGGVRANLNNKGINLEFTHKSGFWDNLGGGIKRGATWMGDTEARIKLDMGKLAGWDDTTAYFLYHSQLGGKFNRDYVGNFMGVDNMETSANTAQFFDAWVQKNFADDSFSVLFGLYPIDSEFYVTDTSAMFIQPPFGMSSEVAQPTLNDPHVAAVYPVGSLTARIKYTSPGRDYYAMYALADGVPGDPNNLRGTHIQLNKGDGTLSIMEFGYTPQKDEAHATNSSAQEVHEEGEFFNKTALGFWRFSAQVNDPLDVNASGAPIRRVNQGAYVLAERTLMVEKDHPSRGLAGFVRFGTASPDVHQADWAFSMGLRYRGLFAGRDSDIAGIAFTTNHASDKYRQISNALSSQTNVEATYRAQIKPWFALLPTVQYVLHPNMDPKLQNVWIGGVRAEFSL